MVGADVTIAPQVRSRRQRVEILFLLSALSTMGAASTDLYVSALPAIAKDWA